MKPGSFAVALVVAGLILPGCSSDSAAPSPSVAASNSTVEPKAPAPPPPLRIATYNVNWANLRLDAVVDAIRKCDADVVCLQEVNPESAKLLEKTFRSRYPHIRFYGSVEEYLAGGYGVLSTRPIVREVFLPVKHGLFGTPVIEIQNGEQGVQIANVHLQPVLVPSQRGLGSVVSLLGAFQDAEEVHYREMQQVLAAVRVDQPCLIVGDFNSCSKFLAPKLALDRGLADSFAAVNTEPDRQPTWHWPTRFGDARLRIDYIFHTPHFRTAESRIIETDGSDHYLLVSQLEVVPPDIEASRPAERSGARP